MLDKILEALPTLEISELSELQIAIHSEITSRKPDYRFEFEATADPRKGYPYVAHITGLDENGKFERTFKDLDRTYGKKEVTVSGIYHAKTGHILEIQEGGSWKNLNRTYHIVDDNGQLGCLGHHDDSRVGNQIKKYLRGEIEMSEFFIN